MKVVGALASCILACAGRGSTDRFVPAGADVTWVTTSDGILKVPLSADVKWEAPAKDSLLKVRGEPGPTFVVASDIGYAPKPVAQGTCAEAHRGLIAAAFVKAGVLATSPTVSEENRSGRKVPRMQYAVPLEPGAGSRPASTISYWTYVIVGSRCVAIGVTTVVRSKPDDPNQPDPEDLARLDRVFGRIAEGTVTR